MNLSELLNLPAARKLDNERQALHPKAERRSWYEIKAPSNKADDSTTEILIYDVIDPDPWFGGVSARDFVQDLAGVDSDNILVRINSPGGDVYDALAITNALRNHDASVTVQIDGLAASAASFIAMAGDEVVMCRNTELMIHDARGICIGTAVDMAEYASWLNRANDNIASIYAEKTGADVKDWRKAMKAETWYTAEEAVEAGLADSVKADDKAADDSSAKKAAAHFDLRAYAHAGRRQAPAPFIPAASAAGPSGKEAPVATLKEGLAERLGIDADADDETTLKAVDEALAERADDTAPPAGDPAPPASDTAPTGDPAAPVAPAASAAGTVTVDREQWEATLAAAAEGREARAQQIREADEALVNSAVGDGRIPPARKAHWLTALASDRDGATAALNGLEKGLIPTSEVGHMSVSDSADTEYAWPGDPVVKA
ncbi:head maturation protease, ClpP-related [Gordonia soli]|uniref:ATP-dependent Clp protease proteolytic subunit n=1 Tax=Gordonia soli NBRC 108243 TaxID=1223545 RepID=M0QPW8_9ACTN|nr:head maturation protease, ClpP-related [Gordonia soli]GAC70735.1 ATP-dependent Clp protease proteolytic subunit [Gordonia soli NBRC 108243]